MTHRVGTAGVLVRGPRFLADCESVVSGESSDERRKRRIEHKPQNSLPGPTVRVVVSSVFCAGFSTVLCDLLGNQPSKQVISLTHKCMN